MEDLLRLEISKLLRKYSELVILAKAGIHKSGYLPSQA